MCTLRLLVGASLLLFAAPASTQKLPRKGEPPLTAQTQASGGMVDAEQAKLRFDSADLAIEVLPDKAQLRGVATLVFTATAPLDELRLDLDRNLPISDIAIGGQALGRGRWSNPDGRLIIRLPARVAANDRLTATIRYAGTPHVARNAPWEDGVVWSKTPDGQTWFATTAEGSGCDLFWPCLDFPRGEPALVTLHITVPKGLKAPSNGRLLGIDTLTDGRTTWHWRARQPNTYGVALNVGPYAELSAVHLSRFGNKVPLNYWYLPGKAKEATGLFAEFAPTLDFFEAVIGPYPFADEKLGVVETPHKGMEHQTINAYGNEYAKASEGFDWLFHHEFAHEYFGNQMTVANWDDYWLHEGYGSYMQPLYGRWREGEARYATMLSAQRDRILNLRPIVSGETRTEEQVYDAAKGGPGTDIYFKASWMLHTLRWLVGDAAFFDVTRRIVFGRSDPKPGNFTPRFATTREYEALVREVTGRDHRWFFDVYLRQAALPDLIETRTDTEARFRWETPRALPFPMPIEISIDGKFHRLDMADGSGMIAAQRDAHIVIDPHARVLRRSRAVEELQAWNSRHQQRDSQR